MKKNIEHMLSTARPELTSPERVLMWTRISATLNPSPKVFMLSPFSRLMHMHRGAVAFILIVVLLVSGGATVVTAEAARPGDVLFPLDQTIERVRIRLAHNDDDRSRLASAFADERLGELRSIVGERDTLASTTEDAHNDERVGVAVSALMRVMDESNMSDTERENVYGHLFTEIDTLSIEVRVDEHSGEEDRDDNRERVKISRDESGSKIEIRKEGMRTRIEKKDGKVRIERKHDDEFRRDANEFTHTQDDTANTRSDTEFEDSTESEEGEDGDEEDEMGGETQPEVRGAVFGDDDHTHEGKEKRNDD